MVTMSFSYLLFNAFPPYHIIWKDSCVIIYNNDFIIAYIFLFFKHLYKKNQTATSLFLSLIEKAAQYLVVLRRLL